MTDPSNPSALVRLLILFVFLIAGAAALQSCKPVDPRPPTMGACATCQGSGVFGPRSCPSCQGLGFIRIHYRYRVIEPMK